MRNVRCTGDVQRIKTINLTKKPEERLKQKYMVEFLRQESCGEHLKIPPFSKRSQAENPLPATLNDSTPLCKACYRKIAGFAKRWKLHRRYTTFFSNGEAGTVAGRKKQGHGGVSYDALDNGEISLQGKRGVSHYL